MKKPNNYENTQVQGEFTPVELGGHKLVIKKVEERMSKTNRPMIVVYFDFAPGDKQAGYFEEVFANDIRPEKKWPNQGTNYILTEDNDGNCSRSFKTFLTCVEHSNNGFETQWGDNFGQQFKNKLVGGVFGIQMDFYNGSQIKNAFTSVNWGSVGMNIIKGIASGLTGAASAIVEAAKSAANKALEAAKSALGIHSPSRVFRDQVGKMMALGMGIGFEKNIPIKSMNVGVQRAVSGLQKSVDLALSARTADKTVGRVKNYPGFDGGKDIDYDRLEKIQMRAAEKMAKRPIYLGTKRIDEPLPKGAVPAL